MNLLDLVPGSAAVKLTVYAVGIAAVGYSAYTLIYKPIEAHGEKLGYSQGVEAQKKETYKETERADAAEKALEDAKIANQTKLDELAVASSDQLARVQAEAQAANKKAATALSNYQKAREEALQALLKAKGAVVSPDASIPYYAPIDTAGLSKPGVDAVNAMVLK